MAVSEPERLRLISGSWGSEGVSARSRDAAVASRRASGRTWVGASGLALVGVVVLWVTLRPTTIDGGLGPEIARFLAALHRVGVPISFDYNTLEFTANIVMFMPLGFFFGLLLSFRWLWVGMILLPLLSVAIETAQLLYLPSRYATVADVLANSLGAWAGLAFAAAVLGLMYRPERFERG